MNQITIKINCAKPDLAAKTKSWLDAFTEEASLFEIANNWDEFWRVYKEEPLLTLLSTGLARTDLKKEISIVREYPVYSNGIHIGSSDLFLNYYKEEKHFFFEAKYEKASYETGFIDWSDENRLKLIRDIERQLAPYVGAEKDASVDSYSVILLFYSLDFKNENDFLEYKRRVEGYKQPANQFYSLFSSKNPNKSPYNRFCLLEVIGHIKEEQKIPNSMVMKIKEA